MSSVEEKPRTVKERVEWILEKYPASRSNDGYLFVLYLRLFEPELSKYIEYIPYTKLIEIAKLFKTIERVRRHIQYNDGKYLPAEPVYKKRRKNSTIIGYKYARNSIQ